MTRAAPLLVAMALGCSLVLLPGGADGAPVTPDVEDDQTAARDLLDLAVRSSSRAHVGEVSIVTFQLDGPRIATVGVRIGSLGRVELRRPARWILGQQGGALVRSGGEVALVTPAGGPAGVDVDLLLQSRRAEVLAPVELDTGPAVPVVLRRRSGAPVEETLFVDGATDMLVRRETRAADGRVLRVVAYTDLTVVASTGPGAVVQGIGTSAAVPAVATSDEGSLPAELRGGFRRVTSSDGEAMASARYSDGLSVLSVYAEEGALDVTSLRSATVLHLAGRDVWTWPGSEPLRLVWTGGGRTWTAVSDAPLEVVAAPLRDLPGEHVPHDLVSRLLRGAARLGDGLGRLVPG